MYSKTLFVSYAEKTTKFLNKKWAKFGLRLHVILCQCKDMITILLFSCTLILIYLLFNDNQRDGKNTHARCNAICCNPMSQCNVLGYTFLYCRARPGHRICKVIHHVIMFNSPPPYHLQSKSKDHYVHTLSLDFCHFDREAIFFSFTADKLFIAISAVVPV